MSEQETLRQRFVSQEGMKRIKNGKICLKKRIQKHYDMSPEHFLKIWGEHIHHGYFKSPQDTREQAQINQVKQLAESAGNSAGARVLDVGCGIGGTARYLARERGCMVTAISNSHRQIEFARKLAEGEAIRTGSQPTSEASTPGNHGFVHLSSSQPSANMSAGAVKFMEVDIEDRQYLEMFLKTFDCIWISEMIFHLHTKQPCFYSAFALLDPGGSLVIADIFAAHDPASSSERERKELASISQNYLCPQLSTVDDYTRMARTAGFLPRHDPIDITKNVARTWDFPLPIMSVLYLITQGRDAISYMRGMRSMKQAYSSGTVRYAILCFEKPERTSSDSSSF